MSLEAVMFDLDGTLVDTLPVCYLAFRRALERAGASPMPDGEIHAMFGPSEEGMLQRVLPEDWPRALPAYFEEYERLLAMCPAVIPELTAALAMLRTRGIRTALVTGKSHVTARIVRPALRPRQRVRRARAGDHRRASSRPPRSDGSSSTGS